MPRSVDEIRRHIEVARSQRADNRDRIFGALPTDSAIEGTFLVDGSGESLKTVNFPVRFINRPSIQFGYELHIDTVAVASTFPMASSIVNRWITDPPIADDGTAVEYSKVYFIGARLIVTTTGPTNQRMWVHWRASGRALVNPTTTGDGITTESIV